MIGMRAQPNVFYFTISSIEIQTHCSMRFIQLDYKCFKCQNSPVLNLQVFYTCNPRGAYLVFTIWQPYNIPTVKLLFDLEMG